ncbi:adenylate/guanylate cyclase domain-containing protein [uncultured Sneathiella sp.]|uniref:adenylate/guanylate cyclase domain-containing protein n=1 Tax=uncultured Sneathiella sp. TaxID=879315 RepID=UPI00259941ED|nr:adenylate/guanylate cyclase domain-containing protein [uncultured Sneathiella sp.]
MTKSLPSPITRMSQAMIVLGICAALIVAFVNLRDKPFIQLIEGQLLDWRFVLRGPIAVDSDIELVLIEKTPEKVEGDMAIAAVDLSSGIDAIAANGARIVVLDPAMLPMSAPGEVTDTAGEDSLARKLAGLDEVIVPYAFSLQRQSGARSALPIPIQKTAYSVFRQRESASIKRPAEAGGYLIPSPELLQSNHPGHVINEPLQTSSRQYAYPIVGYGGSYYPSLAVQAYRRWVGLPMEAIEVNFGESLNIGSLYLPTDNRMRLAVNYHGPGGSYKRTRFSDLLDGSLPADKFKDKLVLVGLAANISASHVSTPFDSAMSEVEYLANVIDNLNRMNPLIRSQQVVVFDILLLALIGLFFALVAAARSIWAVLTLAVIATVLFVAGNIQAFILFNLWLGLTFPLMAMILCTAVLMTAKHVSKRRRAALKVAEEAEETQFAAPWTFDRVAKIAPEETALTEAEEEDIEPEPEPVPEEEEAEHNLTLTPADEQPKTPEERPHKETASAATVDRLEEAEEMTDVSAAQNVTPFPPRKTATGPNSLPVPPKPTVPKSPDIQKQKESAAAAQKNKKPASLIPVLDTPAREEKISLTTASKMAKSPTANNEFDVAVLFINMSGFKTLAKSFGPTRSAQFLHAIYTLIEKTVVKHTGFLEQFGESDVVAVFGLPEGSSDDAENSLRAARELASALSDWGEKQGLPAGKSANFCICADYGPVKVHLNGDGEDPEVSLSGYTIGLASRLDKTVAAKGAGVVVSENMMSKVSETDLTGQLKDGFTEQPMQQIPGSAESVALWRCELGAI